MYNPIVETDGVTAVRDFLAGFGVAPGPDGLVFTPADAIHLGYGEIGMPERLRDWLIDVRLLRRIPLCYLVPDSALMPPESIRFFHVDSTWVDRIIDGVMSVASSGTVDFAFHCSMLAYLRKGIDKDLLAIAQQTAPDTSWTADNGMTGMLIRSELARRWPEMNVRALRLNGNNPPIPVGILRAEPISKDIYIALFAGRPDKVEIMEPNVGTRYGVEPQNAAVSAPPYQVDQRFPDGQINDPAPPIKLFFHNAARRTLRIDLLASACGGTSRAVALHLEQLPYVQEFKTTTPESRGSVPLPPGNTLTLSSGRTMRLGHLRSRLEQMQELKGDA